ncbi:hypothetical protein TrLO_g15154, partial [Triparma laevis f. longispina]
MTISANRPLLPPELLNPDSKELKTQDMLKEKMKNAPPEIKQQDLKYREYANKKKALMEKVETIMTH